MDEEKKSVKTGSEKKGKKSFRLVLVMLFVVVFILAVVAVVYFMINKSENKQSLNQVVLENPMKKIVEEITNKNEPVTTEEVIQKGIMNFNQDFINYILLALGVGELHSFLGFGNPVVELVLDNEVWSSEISGGFLMTKKSPDENKDLKFILSKEEAVKALLSSDIKQFMKESVASGRTQIEMIAGKPELLAKGYLDMYSKLK